MNGAPPPPSERGNRRPPTRRAFLRLMTQGGGLCIGMAWGCKESATTNEIPRDPERTTPTTPPAAAPEPPAEGVLPSQVEGEVLNAWISIEADGTTHLTISESEMGQGILTGLSMVLAEALDVPWSSVRGHHADSSEVYGRQSTGGSTSVRGGGFEAMTEAGNLARALLVVAAARRWKRDPSDLSTDAGAVIAPGGERRSYGELAAAAATIARGPDAARITSKIAPSKRAPSLLGTSPPRLDLPSKVDGTAVYGMDVRRPGMRMASILRCPVFGGALGSVDAASVAATRAVPGVVDVVELPHGVAVVGTNTWACMRGRRQLKVEWKAPSDGATPLTSALLRTHAQEALDTRPIDAHTQGKGAKGLPLGARQLEATYEIPYLAHAPMEPLNCTIEVQGEGDDRRCTVWVPTQSPSRAQQVAAEVLDLPKKSVRVVRTMLGGGFGRRSEADFVRDAALVVARTGGAVQVVWTREDDIQGGAYRPMALSRLRGAVDADGWPVAWAHDLASPSIIRGMRSAVAGEGVDPSSVEGASELPYDIPHQQIRYADVGGPVTTWWWRSVGSSMNAYFVEHFLDELAALGGKDPYQLRRRLLQNHPRHLKVLDAAAEAARWGTPPAKGRARGIAVHESYGSFVAQVAEVSVAANGRPRVHALVCAVDCGQQIHPDAIAAQMEGSVVYGLSAALHDKITLADGRAVQSNFHDYPLLRMDEMPTVTVVHVESGEAHGGVGEPGVPPVAPAICNALLALTGAPQRRLPLLG